MYDIISYFENFVIHFLLSYLRLNLFVVLVVCCVCMICVCVFWDVGFCLRATYVRSTMSENIKAPHSMPAFLSMYLLSSVIFLLSSFVRSFLCIFFRPLFFRSLFRPLFVIVCWLVKQFFFCKQNSNCRFFFFLSYIARCGSDFFCCFLFFCSYVFLGCCSPFQKSIPRGPGGTGLDQRS